jgi:phage terminase large subunit GpA-like protein
MRPWRELDELLAQTFPGADGLNFPIAVLAIDSGYNTQTVYNWARQKPMSRVMAIKGQSHAKTLIGVPSPVDVNFRGKRIARGYKVWPVGVDIAKSELYGWLRQNPPTTESGDLFPIGFCHFPEHGEDYFRQITAEHLVPTLTRTGFVKLEWQLLPGRENHWLDCRVMARAAASLAGLDRMAARTQMKRRAPRPTATAELANAISNAPPAREPEARPRSSGGSWIGGGGRGGAGRDSWLRRR